MDKFTIRCGGLTLTAKHELGGWSSTIDGPAEKYVALKKDEMRAKKACIDVATAMLKRRGISMPACLHNPHWTSG